MNAAEQARLIDAVAEVLDRSEGFTWPARVLEEAPEGSAMRERLRIARETMQTTMRTRSEIVLNLIATDDADGARRAVDGMRQAWSTWARWVEDYGVRVSERWTVSLARGVTEAASSMADTVREAAGGAGLGLALVGGLVLLTFLRR